MYLHIGNGYILHSGDIIGIFDIDRCSIEKRIRSFLADNQKKNSIVEAATDLPRSFIVTTDKLYISGISPKTLGQRIKQLN